MALSTATITYDLSNLVGVAHYKGTSITATTNIPDDVVIDTDGDQIRLGSGKGTISSDGTGSIEVWVPGVDSNPASWQTYIHVRYRDPAVRNGHDTHTFGPFTITASADLADLVDEQTVPPEYAGQLVAELEAIRDETIQISGIDSTDSAVAALVETAAGPLTQAALGDRFARKGHIDIRDFDVEPYIPVDDGTDLNIAGLTDYTTEITAALAEAKASKRPLYFPHGVYGATQLVLPMGVRTYGDGAGGLFSRTGRTVLAQITADVGDFIRFESYELPMWPGVYFNGFGTELHDLVLHGPQSGTIGNGISFRAPDDTPATGVDGSWIHRVAITGFAENGIEIPDGGGPTHLENVILYTNGKYGLDYTTTDPNHNIALHLNNVSGDGNMLGLVRLKDLSNRGSVLVTNLKSEKKRNKYYGVAPVDDNPVQDNALIIENCNETKIAVHGLTHLSSHSTKGPLAAIKIAGAAQPRLVWTAVETRLLTTQTTGNNDAVQNDVTGETVIKKYGTRGAIGVNVFAREGSLRVVPNSTSGMGVELMDHAGVWGEDTSGTSRTLLALAIDGVIKLGDFDNGAALNCSYYAASSTGRHSFFANAVERFRVDTTEVRSYRDLAMDDGRNIKLGTTTGTKIGNGATEKLAFYGATPIVRPASTPAAATDLATALTLVNDLRTKLLALGIIA